MADLSTKFNMNANVEKDYNIGMKMEHQKELKALEFMGAANNEGNVYWLGYDHINKFSKAGCLINYKEKNFKHAYEMRYWMSDKKMFHDLPMKLVAGGKYVLSDATSMNYSLEAANKMHAQAKFSHTLNKNWSVSAHQSYDMAQEKLPYNLGFEVNYNL